MIGLSNYWTDFLEQILVPLSPQEMITLNQKTFFSLLGK